jgi:FAD/FMN-containing dehydrogenase
VPNAVAGRDTAFSLMANADPTPEDRARRDELLQALQPWATGGSFLNFAGVEDSSVEAVRRLYEPEAFARLQTLKATYDPGNLFRINFNIPPRRLRATA